MTEMGNKLAVILLALTLAACGGGGGGDNGGSSGSGGGGGGFGGGRGGGTPSSSSNVTGFAYVTNFQSNNVSAYTIDGSTGALSEIEGSPFAAGVGPTAVAVNRAGSFIYVANGGSFDFTDSVSAFAIDTATGALTNIGAASAGRSSLRSIAVAGDSFVYTTSGGSRVASFEIDAFAITTNGGLRAVDGSPFAAGSNPSAVAVDPSAKFAYVANQASQDVASFTIAATGALTLTGRMPLPSPPLWLTVHPSGKFLYVDGISAFSIDATTGALTEIEASRLAETVTTSMAIDPSGRFAYVSSDRGILAYAINASSGTLTQINGSPFSSGGSFGSVTVDRSGKFLYMVGGGGLHGYTINDTTGTLTEIEGSPLASTGSSIATTANN